MGIPLTRRSMTIIMGMILSLSAVTIMTGDAFAQTASAQAGDFTMTYDPTTSTVYNITYANPNYTILAATQVATSGQNSTIAPQAYCDMTLALTLNNVTVYATDDNDMLLLSTTFAQPGQYPSITVELPSAATAMNFSNAAGTYNPGNTNAVMLSFFDYTMYRMNVTDGAIFYMANAPSTLSSDGKTITFTNTSLATGSSLIVGMTPSGTIKYSTVKQAQNHSLSTNPLTYDPSTGQVTGTYLSMVFDSATGTILDYTNLYTNTLVFSSISTKGDGSFGNGYVSPTFPTTDPIIAGNALFFANQTSIFKIYNNIATLAGFFTSNGTLTMVVAPGLNISTIHFSHNNPGIGHAYGYSYGNFTGLTFGNTYSVMAAPTIISISNSTFKGELFIHDGAVAVTGNTIAISTTDISYVQFVAQNLYLNASLQLRYQLEYALQHGKLGSISYLGSGSSGPHNYNYTYYYNSSLQLTVQNAYTNRVQVQLSSQNQQGSNIALFIPNSMIANNSQFRLTFDNQVMTQLQDANGLLNSTSQTQAQYYISAVDGGTLVLVHVPHFTTHTLEINGTSPASGGFPYLWVGIGAVVVVVGVVLVAWISRSRK